MPEIQLLTGITGYMQVVFCCVICDMSRFFFLYSQSLGQRTKRCVPRNFCLVPPVKGGTDKSKGHIKSASAPHFRIGSGASGCQTVIIAADKYTQ